MDSSSTSNPSENVSIEKIQSLLKTKDDTSRFVGLALLKSVLDNSQELRGNEDVVVTLWKSIPSKFLDRLIRTGSREDSSRKENYDMLDMAVSVLHTFSSMLPESVRRDGRMVDRIPQLVACLLHWYDQLHEEPLFREPVNMYADERTAQRKLPSQSWRHLSVL